MVSFCPAKGLIMAKNKHIIAFRIFFFFFSVTVCTHSEIALLDDLPTCVDTEKMRFTSFLDICLQIWEDTRLLSESERSHEDRMTLHDLIVGRLTRLKHDINRIEQESKDSNTVLISDLEYLVVILKKIEDEFSAEEFSNSSLVVPLARSIREHISLMI